MAVVPLVMGVAMAYFLHQVYLLAMAGLTPVMLLGSYLTERRQGRKSHGARQAEYREHKARIERDAADGAGGRADRAARRVPRPGHRAVDRLRPAAAAVGAAPHRPRLPAAAGRDRRPAVGGGTDRSRAGRAPQAGVLADPGRAGDDPAGANGACSASPVPATRRARSAAGSSPSSPPCTAPTTCRSACSPTPRARRAGSGCAGCRTAGRPAGRGGAALIGNDAESVAARIAELLAIIAERQKALRQAGQQARPVPARHRGGLRRVAQAPVAARVHPAAARGPAGRRVRGLPGRRRAAAARRVPGGRGRRARTGCASSR